MLHASLCFQVITRSSFLHLLVTVLFLLCSWPIFSGFLCSCLLPPLPLTASHFLFSLVHVPHFFSPPFPLLSLVKCVYTKTLRQIDPVMLLRSITRRVSQFSLQTVMDNFYSPSTMLAFSFLFSPDPFSLTLLSHTVATVPPWSEIWSDRLSLHLPVHR